jgi:1L-myo-inositol 1-phosphate cytidylyltransferase
MTAARSTSSFARRRVREAVILAAGAGLRLRGSDPTFLKSLVPVLGRPLISYTIDALVRVGVEKINAVVGFESERLGAALERLVPPGTELRLIENRDWRKQNGISVLASAPYVTAPFLLTMNDHVFEESIIDLLVRDAEPNQLTLAIDKKLNSIFDLDDAMKIQTRGHRVVAVGKDLPGYDAIDTGLFVCPADIFGYLERAKQNDDCSLADGVRLMAGEDKVRGLDIGEAWWQDVDTPEMLLHAEKHLRVRSRRSEIAPIGASTLGNRREN